MGVRRVGPNLYESNHPLLRAHYNTKEVQKGTMVGQSVLVAINSTPERFCPSAIHSTFLKPVLGDIPITWKVEDLANGSTFYHRTIKGSQN